MGPIAKRLGLLEAQAVAISRGIDRMAARNAQRVRLAESADALYRQSRARRPAVAALDEVVLPSPWRRTGGLALALFAQMVAVSSFAALSTRVALPEESPTAFSLAELIAAPARILEPEPLPCAPGTACNPLPIGTLPFRAAGTTRGAPDDRIDVYPCAPEVLQEGPEVWYALDVPSKGTLSASIPESPTDGVDVDLYLLLDPDPESCVARANADLQAEVTPGRYLLVLESCSWPDGRPKPGAYDLTVRFTPAGG